VCVNDKCGTCKRKLKTNVQYEILSTADLSCFPNPAGIEIRVKLENCRIKSYKIFSVSFHAIYKDELSCLLYVFFWVIPRRLNFIFRRFETLCLFHLHRQVCVEWLNSRIFGVSIRENVWLRAKPFPVWIPQQFSNLVILHLPACEDGTDIQHSEHCESLKSRMNCPLCGRIWHGNWNTKMR